MGERGSTRMHIEFTAAAGGHNRPGQAVGLCRRIPFLSLSLSLSPLSLSPLSLSLTLSLPPPLQSLPFLFFPSPVFIPPYHHPLRPAAIPTRPHPASPLLHPPQASLLNTPLAPTTKNRSTDTTFTVRPWISPGHFLPPRMFWALTQSGAGTSGCPQPLNVPG